jgi:ribonuclease HII
MPNNTTMKPILEINYSGKLHECGVDEVGRGCLAGPVVAAAVILSPDFYHPKLRDSKKMSASAREEVANYIKIHAVAYGIASVDAGVIDRINILEASMEAMHNAIYNMQKVPGFIIVDGNQFRQFKDSTTYNLSGTRIISHKCIIKGDDKYASIAAASVLAKVHRDNYMKELSKEFPGYGWETNMGYGTPEHLEALRTIGDTIYHRKTFSYPRK